MVIMIKEGSTRFVNFMTQGLRVFRDTFLRRDGRERKEGGKEGGG